ncbi:hypothetical protein Fleli_2939 [Bernardetia litoralis DSM 6794]|uniref:Uncharacterized protein n=1 Tax=Bernardetia litoralis (strain ATCC 23117 / DSM 6794 / NBRC 15988 / NCIMB 1366 / Fx l1 / Sio-4) TaxID=880071 RepID=I4AMV1_BERLS|nr:hypothetical protein Fleli_2939 [Bernardetia litoralis DSM 6794]
MTVVCFACSKEKLYRYQDDFELYLKEVHQLKESDFEESIFYVLDIESCSCSELNLKSLSMLLTSNNLVLITVGKSKIWENYKSKLNHFTILEDSTGKVHRYETGLGKPLLLHYRNQEIIYYQNVIDPEVAKASAYILNPN